MAKLIVPNSNAAQANENQNTLIKIAPGVIRGLLYHTLPLVDQEPPNDPATKA